MAANSGQASWLAWPIDLVDDVGLRRVQRLRRVAQVLGGVEDGVGEGAVEIAQRGQAGDGVVAERRERLEAAADLGELGDVVGGQAEFFLGLQERPAGVGVVERLQLAGDDPPHVVLDDRVVGPGDGVPGLPVDGQGGEVVAPLAVRGVPEPGVIGAEDDLDLTLPVAHDGCVQRPSGHGSSVGRNGRYV